MSERFDPYELAGEYVLGTLSRERRREVDAMLPNDATLRAAVAYWEERLLPLSALVEPVAPPPALWTRIERSLGPASVSAVGCSGWWEIVRGHL